MDVTGLLAGRGGSDGLARKANVPGWTRRAEMRAILVSTVAFLRMVVPLMLRSIHCGPDVPALNRHDT